MEAFSEIFVFDNKKNEENNYFNNSENNNFNSIYLNIDPIQKKEEQDSEANAEEHLFINNLNDSFCDIISQISKSVYNIDNSKNKTEEKEEILNILNNNNDNNKYSNKRSILKPKCTSRANSSRTINLSGRILTNYSSSTNITCNSSLYSSSGNVNKCKPVKPLSSSLNIVYNNPLIPERVSNPFIKREKSCFISSSSSFANV